MCKCFHVRLRRLIARTGRIVSVLCAGWLLACAQQPPPPPHHNPDLARKRAKWEFDQRAYPLGSIPEAFRLKALEQLEDIQHRENVRRKDYPSVAPPVASSTLWTLIGPQPIVAVPYPPDPVLPGSGIVDAFAVDPRNASVAFVGGEGGVWRTTDGGANWMPLTDTQSALSIGSIVLDPSNPDIIYAGTGGVFATYAAGLLKSNDQGATWTQLSGPFEGPFGPDSFFGGSARILSLSVNPTDGQILLAAIWRWPQSDAGIFRSADAGTTWKQVLSGPGLQVLFDSTNGNIAYAAIGGYYGDPGSGIYRSIDGGMTWTFANGTAPNVLPPSGAITNITLAVAPSNSSIVYAQVNTAGGPSEFKTTDGGKNWAAVTGFSANSCCNRMVVHPSNPNIVFTGGVGLSRSLDGGDSWSDVTGGLHVDVRSFAFSADGSVLYVGNDGGAFSTANVTDASVTWKSLNATLATVIFSAGNSIHPTDVNFALGGTQDNGTLRYSGDLAWSSVTCGDGGWTAIDPITPSTVYATCQNIYILKSTSSGYVGTWQLVQNGIDVQDRSSFIPPFVMDPSNSSTLYFGTYRVYQTTDGASSWMPISPDLTGGSYHYLTTIAVAPTDSNTVYAATDDSHVQATRNAGAGVAANWSNQGSGLPPRFITQLAVDAKNALSVYVTFSGYSGFFDSQGHVFRTSNGGEGWVDISGNLPNIPVNDIVLDPDLPNTIYVATDVGVFWTSSGGATWSALSSGLPHVVIDGLKLHRSSRTLWAATHGRSMWELFVPLTGSNPTPSVATLSPSSVITGGPAFTLVLTGSGFVPGSIVQWNGSNRSTTFVNLTELRATITTADISIAGTAKITVVSPAPGGGLSSPLLLTITTPSPTVTITGVSNNASGQARIEGGSWVSIYGTNLSATTRGWRNTDFSGINLPIVLDGVSVKIDGKSAAICYISPGQLNIQAPLDSSIGQVQVEVTGPNGSAAGTANLQAYAPGFFTFQSRYVAAVHADGVYVAPPGFLGSAIPSRPAQPGEIVAVFGTGFGPTTPVVPSGQLLSGAAPLTDLSQLQINVGGVIANVVFAGIVTAGEYQFNVVIPSLSDGDQPITADIGGVSAQSGLLIPIKN